MVSNSILIDLLPKEEKRKTKIHKLIVVLAITILAISISVIGVFFISQKKVLACHCGDGSVNQPSEQCDTTIPQACIINGYNGLKNCVGCLWSNCIPNESCGDGITNGNEQCDDGNSNNLDGCRNNCTLLYCGDGILDNGEQCDDGNTVNGDGCSATCDLEQTGPVCGNGIIESGEQCDDSNTINGDGCSATCQLEQNPPACSDGHLDAGEQCDDGNIIDGDGCSANCTIEKGTLTVCKYNDVNKNGVYDVATDTPLVWNMTIINPGGSTTTAQTSATSGCVSLADLPYGTYSVQEEDKTNWLRSFPSVNPTQAIISSTSIDMLINFLNYEQEGPGPEYGSITVCKLIDQDGLASTTNDRYEATTTLWSFNLISQTSTTTKTTASGTNCVVFDNLLAGDYQVNEVLDSGWQLIDPEQNNINVNLTAAENKNFTFINSALVVPLKGKIFGYKYNDANNNGVIDSDEQKMSGWLMQLIACPYAPLGTSTIQFLPN
ncbi:MAG: DUF4215 domain-containing protein, partial [Candidatus Falkowbacteria bacterium]|nr:DUF4215 domain-containing protein [Candidatus Falkowbacteria bacterium]